jgi:2-octaprenyl-6-methoxyphenol hydroxylase
MATPSPFPGSDTPPGRRPFTALVRGAGPTGALAALALADAGWQVAVVDPSSRERLLARGRAYAFTHSSRRLLLHLGLWDRLLPRLAPFHQLHLNDLGCQRASRFSAADLWGNRSGAQPVGWIGAHGPLMDLLLTELEARPAIQLQLGSGHPATASEAFGAGADLVVAADGPSSPTREGLGIRSWRHPYRQHCLSAQVGLRGAPGETAWEQLRPEGPFAVLPMGGERFQVVWSAPAWRCQQLESLSPAAFLDALAAVLPEGIEVVSLLEPQRAFPVALQLARRMHRGHTILVGETAHRCHPVGGQGLNLCWRDVAVLHALARRAQRGRLSITRLGASYGRRRWVDAGLTLLITDGLVRLFSNRHPLLLPLRAPALRLLAHVPPLRRCVLGAMTHGPCQPFQAVAR